MNKKGNTGLIIAGIAVALFIWLILIPFVRNNLADNQQPQITKEDLQERGESILQNMTSSVSEKSYVNSQFGFKVTYPSKWIQFDTDLEHTIVKFSPEDGNARVTIKRYPNDDLLTQEEFVSMIEENKQEYIQTLQDEGLESVTIEKTSLNGVPVHKITYFETNQVFNQITNKYDSFRFKVISYFIILNKDIKIGINYVALPEYFDSYLAEGTEILNSFEKFSENQKGNSLSYSNYGFTIQYPTYWTYNEFSDDLMGRGVVLKDTDELKGENVVILIQDLSANPMNLEEYTELSLKQAPQLVDEYKLVESGDILLGGNNAKKIVYTGNQQDIDLKYYSVWTVKNNQAYVIAYTAQIDDYSRSIDVANNIISSFIFN